MKRIVYYVVHASAGENQKGTFHCSKPFPSVEKAMHQAKTISDDFVVIERHYEVFQGSQYKPEYQWELDWERENPTEIVEYL